MIANFYSPLLRVTLFWYILGALVLFFGLPEWAETRYQALSVLPWVPELELDGLETAATVQWTILAYWTLPVFLLWAVCLAFGAGLVEFRYRNSVKEREFRLLPRGKFWGVYIFHKSLGTLPPATTPSLSGRKVAFDTPGSAAPKTARKVTVEGSVKEALKMLSPAERMLCEELLQVLVTDPDHFAGLGHGVGLLEHTLNVTAEAAAKCTPEFRLPLVAALAHDIGKLITFQPDGNGGWIRRGLHSRESARILATLPSFQELPEPHQRGLILAVKYDHAPNKMPDLRGDREASMLAMRIISALSSADKSATAAEKERNLVKLQPEDLLWKDFVDNLRDAPVVQLGKKGGSNQVNNPADSPFLFLYEAQWRDEAICRLPEEVAAALDLTRRDVGKLAKYTRILTERLRKEGLLVEEHLVTKDGANELLKTAEGNPLWDIQSGRGEKAVVMRGILVLRAEDLWKKLNYRISTKSPYPVSLLAPNASLDGKVNQAPQANREMPGVPEVSDGMKLSADSLTTLGLEAPSTQGASAPAKPKSRGRGAFRAPATDSTQDAMLGFSGQSAPPRVGPVLGPEPPAPPAPAPAPAVVPVAAEPAAIVVEASEDEANWDDATYAEMEAMIYGEGEAGVPADTQPDSGDAMASALAFLQSSGVVPVSEPAEAAAPPVAQSPEPAMLAAPAEVMPQNPSDNVPGLDSGSRPARARPSPAAQRTKPAQQATPAAQIDALVESVQPATTDRAPAVELSRAEKREGLAIADETAVAKYPSLTLGDKFYTEESGAVKEGLRKPGARYKGDSRDRALDLSEAGPRRRVRRAT